MKDVFKKRSSIVLFAIILLVVSCKKEDTNISENIEVDNSTPVTVIEVNNSDFYEYGEYYGRVQGVNRSSIINILGGTVESVDVVEGAVVSKGDSLALISSDKARIAYESAKLSEKISRDDYYTKKKFLENGNSSQINVDRAHLQWLTSKTQLIDAKKAYEAAYCIAQIDGTVVSRNINVDDEVQQGHNTFLIENLSQIEINIGIPEGDMEGVKVGSEAEVYVDLYPNRKWDGVLTRHSMRSSDRNLTFTATILVDNKDGEILSGTTAKVKLLRNSYEDSVIIPNNSIIKELDGNFVMVLNEDRVNKRKVNIKTSSIEKSVIESGLEVGDIIVQEGLHLLSDSQQVKVIDQGV